MNDSKQGRTSGGGRRTKARGYRKQYKKPARKRDSKPAEGAFISSEYAAADHVDRGGLSHSGGHGVSAAKSDGGTGSFIRRWAAFSSWIFIAAFLPFISGLIVFWWNQEPPIRYQKRSIVTEKVYPGHPLIIKVESRGPAKRTCKAQVRRIITDSAGQSYDFELEDRPTQDSYSVVLDLPLAARPGKAYYTAEIHWMCNPLQHRWPYIVEQAPLEFEVLPTPAQGLMLQQYEPEKDEARANQNPTRSPN